MAALEAPLLSPAVRAHVVVNAVADVPPGAHRDDAPCHALTPLRKPAERRAAAQAVALDQEVIDGAAAVCVLAIDPTRQRIVHFAARGVPVP